MAIELATQFLSAVDELFSTESRKSLLTNQDYSWSGAHSIKVYSVSTAQMNDYGRNGPDDGNWSRYGEIKDLNATTQEMPLRMDRSFTFAVDRLDTDETKSALQAAYHHIQSPLRFGSVGLRHRRIMRFICIPSGFALRKRTGYADRRMGKQGGRHIQSRGSRGIQQTPSARIE